MEAEEKVSGLQAESCFAGQVAALEGGAATWQAASARSRSRSARRRRVASLTAQHASVQGRVKARARPPHCVSEALAQQLASSQAEVAARASEAEALRRREAVEKRVAELETELASIGGDRRAGGQLASASRA